MRAPPEMLHEVITNTIYLDNAINEIISIYFHAYNFKEDEEGKSSTLEPVERFHRLFLQELGFSSKLKIIRDKPFLLVLVENQEDWNQSD